MWLCSIEIHIWLNIVSVCSELQLWHWTATWPNHTVFWQLFNSIFQWTTFSFTPTTMPPPPAVLLSATLRWPSDLFQIKYWAMCQMYQVDVSCDTLIILTMRLHSYTWLVIIKNYWFVGQNVIMNVCKCIVQIKKSYELNILV